MATATLTIKVDPRWWVSPFMRLVTAVTYCRIPVNTNRVAKLVAKHGFVLKPMGEGSE